MSSGVNPLEDGEILAYPGGLTANLQCPDCHKPLKFAPNTDEKRLGIPVGFKSSHCGNVITMVPRDMIVSVRRKPIEERITEGEKKIESMVDKELSGDDKKDAGKRTTKRAEVAQRLLNAESTTADETEGGLMEKEESGGAPKDEEIEEKTETKVKKGKKEKKSKKEKKVKKEKAEIKTGSSRVSKTNKKGDAEEAVKTARGKPEFQKPKLRRL